MSWFHKSSCLAALAVLALANAGAKKKDDTKPAPTKAEEKAAGDKADKADKGDEKSDGKRSTDGAKGPAKISVPVPPGHDAKGLVIPYRDEKGNMQMRFTMDVGARTDEEHMAMKKLLIETFDETGKPEMSIDLPESNLNLTTRVITTESGVLIKREDFELSGQTMEFNTETRSGHLAGKVRMLIYNLENETNSADEAAPSEK